MKLLKKALTSLGIVVIVVTIIFSYINKTVYAETENNKQELVKIGVILYKADDVYISLVQKSLEEIQMKNQGKIEFTFYDSKNNQSVQNQIIQTLLQGKNVDLLLLNLVDVKSSYEVINKIKQYNIPVVLFNREPLNMDSVKSYNKAFFVGTDSSQAGELQGKIIINIWGKHKTTIDASGDNILQYIMLMGERENKDAIQRTQHSISTINNAGIQTQEIDLLVCDWSREIAKANFEPLFLRHGNKIEAIISNNDEMAIGAIEVLQKYGYNKGNNKKTIAVVGVDGIPDAQELIKEEEMTGTVFQDAPAMAEACYVIGMNLVNDKSPLNGTQYKADDTGISVRIPYKEYIK